MLISLWGCSRVAVALDTANSKCAMERAAQAKTGMGGMAVKNRWRETNSGTRRLAWQLISIILCHRSGNGLGCLPAASRTGGCMAAQQRSARSLEERPWRVLQSNVKCGICSVGRSTERGRHKSREFCPPQGCKWNYRKLTPGTWNHPSRQHLRLTFKSAFKLHIFSPLIRYSVVYKHNTLETN